MNLSWIGFFFCVCKAFSLSLHLLIIVLSSLLFLVLLFVYSAVNFLLSYFFLHTSSLHSIVALDRVITYWVPFLFLISFFTFSAFFFFFFTFYFFFTSLHSIATVDRVIYFNLYCIKKYLVHMSKNTRNKQTKSDIIEKKKHSIPSQHTGGWKRNTRKKRWNENTNPLFPASM